jgi:hypothetical protein
VLSSLLAAFLRGLRLGVSVQLWWSPDAGTVSRQVEVAYLNHVDGAELLRWERAVRDELSHAGR